MLGRHWPSANRQARFHNIILFLLTTLVTLVAFFHTMEGHSGDQPRTTPEQLIQAFQITTAELKRTFQDSCASHGMTYFNTSQSLKRLLHNKSSKAQIKKWKKESSRKQLDFYAKVIENFNKATKAMKAGDSVGCSAKIEQAMKKLTTRQKLIRLAYTSESGWQTMKEYESKELASDSEDEKRINRAEAWAAKKHKRSRSLGSQGSSRFRPYTSSFRPHASTTTNAVTSSQRSYPYSTRPAPKTGSCFSFSLHWPQSLEMLVQHNQPKASHLVKPSRKDDTIKDKCLVVNITRYECEQGITGKLLRGSLRKHKAFWLKHCSNDYILDTIIVD